MTSVAAGGSAPVPIVALDVADLRSALAVADRLGGACRFYKVGGELFTAAGPDAVRRLVERGADVFLDLKFHDIPNTVAGAVRSAADLGARLVTVHGVGGPRMLGAAVAAADRAGTGCGVLAVTVLTSMDATEAALAWGRPALDVGDEVLRLAGDAASAGAHGVVCSGHEAARVRDRLGPTLATLGPGIRLPGDAGHDQARVVTPADAARVGARYVVVGRTVTAAADPVSALAAVSAGLTAVPSSPRH